MTKLMKQSFALFMAVIMFVTAVSTCGFAYASDVKYPYVDSNGTYWRISNGVPTAFNTDYDKMVSYFQQQLLNRADKIDYNFATTDKEYAYIYEKSEDKATADKVAEKLYSNLFSDIFKTNTDNCQLGDYLYNSVDINVHSYNPRTSSPDNPVGDNPRYYTFTISMSDINYFSTVEQEKQVYSFAEQFSKIFLENCDTDYKKVKTIYDFIVRNATYDYDVFDGKYASNSDRYLTAHSAYGAIYGSLIKDKKSVADYDFTTKDSVTAQKIIDTYNQGLAVCEGYSKLFYYLCTYNGIKCRILDGDYIDLSGKSSDPHEWNYVYLDDGFGDGYKWFQVDTTFASQKSYKEIDLNNYDYFLCGRSNINFGYMNHQQPYEIDDNGVKMQLYDWYIQENLSSYEDYQIPLVDLDTTVSSSNETVIIKRSTVYSTSDDVRTSYIITDTVNSSRVEIDEDGNFTYNDVKGFNYNGNDSNFAVVIPYLIDREYVVDDSETKKECGDYTINIKGDNNTTYQTKFSIVPLDMSNDKSGHYDDFDVQTSAGYTGNVMIPSVYVVDQYKNKLYEGVDYDVSVYSDSNHTNSTEIKDIGTYYLDIAYKGNYTGHYYLTFYVDKIELNQINSKDYEFEYLPKYYREYNNINDATDYFIKSGANLKVGDITLHPNVDFSLKAKGGLEYGDEGTITLTGINSSTKVKGGTTLTLNYKMSEKFDVKEHLDKTIADSNKTNVYYYTGSEIEPTEFDYLDERLEKGKDYKIVSYNNNVNKGEAEVIIEGINGCTGRATLYFLINPESISKCKITTSSKNGNVSYTVSYNDKQLVKNTDYTETITETTTGYQITIKGINNFSGSTVINVTSDKTASYVKPTTSGNYVTLSASSYTYDGKVKKPTVKIYNKNKKQINSYYYTVSYSSGRKNVGTYTVTVKFRNGYSGSLKKTFKINPKGTTISKLTATSKGFKATWKKQATQTTGYQIRYSTKSNMSGAKTVTISKNSTTSKTISKLSAKKKYYVQIRTYKTVNGTKYYSSWSGSKTVTTKK